jgi:hypothetical protein
MSIQINAGGTTVDMGVSGTKKAFGLRSQSESLGSFVMDDNVSQTS